MDMEREGRGGGEIEGILSPPFPEEMNVRGGRDEC